VSSAYRKLALKYHPDRHPGDDAKREMFETLKKASDILQNERKKKIYD
jgi:DnaJ-class molecular chaperone